MPKASTADRTDLQLPREIEPGNITVTKPGEVPVYATTLGMSTFTQAQIEVIRSQLAPGCPDDRLRMYLWECERTRLDPLIRQIYLIPRDSKIKNTNPPRYETKWTTQTSIDGFRVIAERSGKYMGQLGPFWCDLEGTWVDVWTKDYPPVAAKIGALRSDFREPAWGVANFRSFAATSTWDGQTKLTGLWAKMPEVMIAKCAEAAALRKAFPNDLGGLYTDDEMHGADADGEVATARQEQQEEQREKITAPAPAKERRSRTANKEEPCSSASNTAPPVVATGGSVAPTPSVPSASCPTDPKPGDPFSNETLETKPTPEESKNLLDQILSIVARVVAKHGQIKADSHFDALCVAHGCVRMGDKCKKPSIGTCPVGARSAMLKDLMLVEEALNSAVPALAADGFPMNVNRDDVKNLMQSTFMMPLDKDRDGHREVLRAVNATWGITREQAIAPVGGDFPWRAAQEQLAGTTDTDGILRAYYVDLSRRLETFRAAKGIKIP